MRERGFLGRGPPGWQTPHFKIAQKIREGFVSILKGGVNFMSWDVCRDWIKHLYIQLRVRKRRRKESKGKNWQHGTKTKSVLVGNCEWRCAIVRIRTFSDTRRILGNPNQQRRYFFTHYRRRLLQLRDVRMSFEKKKNHFQTPSAGTAK